MYEAPLELILNLWCVLLRFLFLSMFTFLEQLLIIVPFEMGTETMKPLISHLVVQSYLLYIPEDEARIKFLVTQPLRQFFSEGTS